MNRARTLLAVLALSAACAHAPGAGPAPEPAPAAAVPPAPAPAPLPPAVAPAPHPAAPAPSPGRADRTVDRAPARPAASPRAATSGSAALGPGEFAGPGEYFPLALGNEWVYLDESPALPPARRGVRRTVRILDRTADGYYEDNDRGELRVDGECVRDRVRRLLCRPFQTGATWASVVSVTSTERYEIAAVDEAVVTPAGRFERCVRVRAHNRATADVDHVLEITYAPRVGPIRIETYVVVNGRATPQVKAVLESYRVEGR